MAKDFSFLSQSIHSNKLLPEKFSEHRAFYKKYQRSLCEEQADEFAARWGIKDLNWEQGAEG